MATPASSSQQTASAGQQTATSYPYGPYHPPTGAYGQTPTTYSNPYQTTASYQTGVTGYGAWPYQYGYVPQQHSQSTLRPTMLPGTATSFTPTFSPSVPQRSTFSTYTPTHLRDSGTASTGAAPGRGSRKQQSNFKGSFSKELKSLMYGFGDDRNPENDAVNVMEEILIEYITDVCTEAGTATRKSRLSIEDLRRALSRPADAKKLARMEELLFMQEDIKRARAQFEEADINHTKEF